VLILQRIWVQWLCWCVWEFSVVLICCHHRCCLTEECKGAFTLVVLVYLCQCASSFMMCFPVSLCKLMVHWVCSCARVCLIADEDSVKVVEVSVSESRPLAVRSVLYFTMVCWLVSIISLSSVGVSYTPKSYVCYNSDTDNMVYIHFFSRYCLRNLQNRTKFWENSNLKQFKVIQSHWSWSQ